ncbi:MAG: DUF1640 domain-containing protein [Methylococcales bacterium]|nr:DUF1640 domain-containing protein [Methylococcales bacterium]
MSLAIPFDTLEFASDLIDGGVPEPQAKAIAKTVSKAQQKNNAEIVEQIKHDYRLDDVATKRDIKELELKIELVKADLQRDIESVRKEISDSRTDLIKWFVGTAFAIASIGFMLARFFTNGAL